MKIHSIRPLPALVSLFIAATSLSFAAESKMLKVGDKAPLISGKDQDDKPWSLKDEIGKKIVLLYFYPKDQTPGCTKEACAFRDNLSDFQKDIVMCILHRSPFFAFD